MIDAGNGGSFSIERKTKAHCAKVVGFSYHAKILIRFYSVTVMGSLRSTNRKIRRLHRIGTGCRPKECDTIFALFAASSVSENVPSCSHRDKSRSIIVSSSFLTSRLVQCNRD